VIDVSGDHYVDHEKEVLAYLARDWRATCPGRRPSGGRRPSHGSGAPADAPAGAQRAVGCGRRRLDEPWQCPSDDVPIRRDAALSRLGGRDRRSHRGGRDAARGAALRSGHRLPRARRLARHRPGAAAEQAREPAVVRPV